MNRNRKCKVYAGAVSLMAAVLLGVSSAPASEPKKVAAGVEIDLLPTVASAVDGELGGALQVWVGRGRERLRLVGASLHYPDALTEDPFSDRRNTTLALLYDRFFRDGFTGPWVAVGAEYWWNSIGLQDGEERGEWSGPVATVGAGWVFPIGKTFYLNPWMAVHAPLSTGSVAVGAESFQPRAIQAEVSLKLGWAFSVNR